MKKLFLLFLLCPFLTQAQEAVVHFDIKNSSNEEISIIKGNYSDADVLFGQYYTDIPLVNGKTSYTSNVSRPVFLTLFYQGDSTKAASQYVFYLMPGDNLNFSVDALNPESTSVTGKGSNNNQPDIQKLWNLAGVPEPHKKDSVPGPVFRTIKKQSKENQELLQTYIAKHNPSKEFINIQTLYVEYYPTWAYVRFKGNQKFNVRKAYYRNEAAWEAIEDSLVRAAPLNKPELMDVPTHTYFLSNYLGRLKERVWNNPELEKKYRLPGQTTSIMQIDPENLLRERIVDKHFTGTTAEFLYAYIFKESINENEDSLPEIYERFKKKYPKSQYLSFIEPAVKKMLERGKHKLSKSMKFLDSKSYLTFDDMLKLIKGKTVLLDMWGTWCGPCRSELAQNSDSIKAHFEGKALEYLYIANYDSGKDAKWKELIAYYNLTGTHILASELLTNDIMSKVKGEGYPTYVIIKKDGTFELSEAGYPMKREVLIKQLEKALND